MVDVRFLSKQMPHNRSLTRPWLVKIKTDRALMTGTLQHSLHATVPRSAVWRVVILWLKTKELYAASLSFCTEVLRVGDELFYPTFLNVFKIYITFLRCLTFLYFFLNVFTSMAVATYESANGHTTVTSKVSGFPSSQGTKARRAASLVTGISAETMARATNSFKAWCLPGAFLQTKLCSP